MREINEIFVHCSATAEGVWYDVDDIDRWHKEQGWSGVGYHAVITLDGTVQPGRPVEQAGAHVSGRNADSLGVCYIGGLDATGRPKDTRTPEQQHALLKTVNNWMAQYGVPVSRVLGHYEVANKACPSFDMGPFRAQLSQDIDPQDRMALLPVIGGDDVHGEIRQLQLIVGVKDDGFIGQDTYRALMEYLA